MNKQEVENLIKQSTMTNHLCFEFFTEIVHNLTKNNVQGDIVECGVWMGGCSAKIAQVLMESKDERTIRLFDSFDDICEPLPLDGPRLIKQVGGLANAKGRLQPVKGFYKKRRLVGPGDEKHVENLMVNVVGYPKDKVAIYKGWFQNTLAPACQSIDKIALLILDCDLYASIKICLEYMYPKLVKGGAIVIDDYHYYDGAKLAVDEYVKKNNIKVDIQKSGYAWWYK